MLIIYWQLVGTLNIYLFIYHVLIIVPFSSYTNYKRRLYNVSFSTIYMCFALLISKGSQLQNHNIDISIG